MLDFRTQRIPPLYLMLFPFLGQANSKAEHVVPLLPNKQPALKSFSSIDPIYGVYLATNCILVVGATRRDLCVERPGAVLRWTEPLPAGSAKVPLQPQLNPSVSLVAPPGKDI